MTSSRWSFVAALAIGLLTPNAPMFAQPTNADATAYLFSTFKEVEQDGLRFAFSYDAYHWSNIPGLFLKAQVGDKPIMRDPSITRGPDGTWQLVWTSAWRGNNGFGYSSSKDLVHWSEQKFIPAMAHEPTVCNVWAPELFYDERERQFIICWASTIPGRFPDYFESSTNNHRMYYTTTRDFQTFAPTKLFLDPGFSVIDCQILKIAPGSDIVSTARPIAKQQLAGGTPALPGTRMLTTSFSSKTTPVRNAISASRSATRRWVRGATCQPTSRLTSPKARPR